MTATRQRRPVGGVSPEGERADEPTTPRHGATDWTEAARTWFRHRYRRPRIRGPRAGVLRRRFLRRSAPGTVDLTDPAAPAERTGTAPGPQDQPDASEVHPRIARRRAEVRRERRSPRRLLRWAPLAFALVATLAVAALFSPAVDLDHLEVVGLEGEPAARVREAVSLDDGTAMFGVRPSEVRDRVESIGWVAHADVDVRWPDRVVVTATPHRPVATLREGTGPRRVLTASAEVLDRDQAGPLWAYAAHGPEVRLAAGAGSEGRAAAAAVLAQLRPVAGSMLSELRIARSGSVELGLDMAESDGTVEVQLGTAEQLPAKAIALDSVLGGAVDRTCMDRIDVSVPTRVTVLRSAACTVPGPAGDADD